MGRTGSRMPPLEKAETATYVVFKENNVCKVKRGSDGVIVYSNNNDATGIQWAFDNLTAGRTFKERVLLKGNFITSATIEVPSHTILQLDGKVKLANSTDASLLRNDDQVSGNTEIYIIGGEWDGNRANVSVSWDKGGMQFENVTNSKIVDVWIHDVDDAALPLAQGRSLSLSNCENINVARLKVTNYTKAIFITGGSKHIDIIEPLCIGDDANSLAITMYGGLGTELYYISIIGGKFSRIGQGSNFGTAIHFYQYVYYSSAIGNTIEMSTSVTSNAGIGCSGHSNIQYNIVANNIIHCNNKASYGIRWGSTDEEDTVKNNLTTGNIIYDPALRGIEDRYTYGNQYVDNQIFLLRDNNRGYLIKYSNATVIDGGLIKSLSGLYQMGVWLDDTECDDTVIRNLTIDGTDNTMDVGINCDDGDDIVIQNNRIWGCTTPIDVNVAAVVRPMIMGNNWEGCTNQPNIVGATNERVTSNIDISGGWWGTGDNPA